MPPPSRTLPPLPAHLKLVSSTQVASLWSNYGHIYRLKLASSPKSLILKSIHPPALDDEPSESHLRKLLSYDVERWFYKHLSSRLPPSVKVAEYYPLSEDAEHNLLLEDLSAEYPFPASGSLNKDATLCVLEWLAGFHGTFFRAHHANKKSLPLIPPPMPWKQGTATQGVWQRGTYFYLDTRREELADMDTSEHGWLVPWVEKVNDAIEREIKQYGTLVHGDVKGANIVFNRDVYPHRSNRRKKAVGKNADNAPLKCALYDLQYVGLGLPTLDLVYFLGTSVESSLLSPESEKNLLQTYHSAFMHHISEPHAYDFDTFWRHWELALVDWYRFMAGWGCWGNDRWVERRAREIVRGWEAQKVEQL